MKICFIAPRFHTNQHATVETLIEHGHQVSFYVTDLPDTYHSHSIYTPLLIPTKELPWFFKSLIARVLKIFGRRLRKPFYTFPKVKSLYRELKSNKPDVLIIRDLLSPLSLFSLTIARLLKIKTILYQQKPLEQRPGKAFRLAQLLSIAPHTIITPIREGSLLQKKHGKTIAYYCPLASSHTEVIHRHEYFKGGKVNILSIGKFTLKRKNHIALINALASLRQYDFNLTLIGTSPSQDNPLLLSIKKCISDCKLDDNVTILSNIPLNEIDSYYKNNDLFVLPSYREPYAITPLEAMSYGLPVIVTEDNGTKYDINNGETGYVVSVEDNCLKNQLSYLLRNPEKIAIMGREAKQYYQKNHSKASVYQHFMRAIS